MGRYTLIMSIKINLWNMYIRIILDAISVSCRLASAVKLERANNEPVNFDGALTNTHNSYMHYRNGC